MLSRIYTFLLISFCAEKEIYINLKKKINNKTL